MTSSTGAEEHPDVVEISALTDGLLSPAQSAELRQHLDACSLCDDVHASLEEIRSLLGTLPGPVRMPVDVEERIDAALAAEALLDARSASRTRLVSRETEHPHVTQKTSPALSVSRETAGAKDSDRSPRRPRSPTHPGAGTGPSPRRGRGRRPRPRLVIAAGAAAAATLFGAFLVHGLLEPAGENTAGGAPRPESTRAQGLTAADLENQVHHLLAAPSGPKARSSAHTDSSSLNPLRSSAVTLPPCVRAAIDQPELPLAAAPETYAGRAAYLVVLPRPSEPRRVNAYVIARSCVSSSTKVGQVLYRGSYTRD